jgi:hypothetical protein
MNTKLEAETKKQKHLQNVIESWKLRSDEQIQNAIDSQNMKQNSANGLKTLKMRITLVKPWQTNNGNNINGRHKSLQKFSCNNKKKEVDALHLNNTTIKSQK